SFRTRNRPRAARSSDNERFQTKRTTTRCRCRNNTTLPRPNPTPGPHRSPTAANSVEDLVQPDEITFLSYGLIGYLVAPVVVVLMISLRKEIHDGEPVRGVFWFGV